jgi:hypothetical protein
MNDRGLVLKTREARAALRLARELSPIEWGDYSQLYRDPIDDVVWRELGDGVSFEERAAIDAENDRYDAAIADRLHPRTADEVARYTPEPIWPCEPLEPYRDVLGIRGARLETLDMQAADRVSRLEHDQLLAERDRAARALEHLDPEDALETQDVQHALEVAGEEAVAVWLESGQTAARLAELGRRRGRRRRGLQHELATQREMVLIQLEDCGRLEAAEQDLHDAGRHLDDWLAENEADVVTWIAAERELAARRAIALGSSGPVTRSAPREEAPERNFSAQRPFCPLPGLNQ